MTEKTAEKISNLKIISPAFKDGDYIPSKYCFWGENINPEIKIENIPSETKSLAIIMDDPDSEKKTWVHWLIWNIKPHNIITENFKKGIMGKNDFGNMGYDGPSPPKGEHRYFFKIYALDSLLNLGVGSNKNILLKAIQGHILGAGEIIGKFKKIS